MVPVGGHPVLWHIMKGYELGGITDFVVCLGYKGEVIREYFATSPTEVPHSWSVSLIETGADTMTGGRVFRATQEMSDETFACTYGDGLADLDIAGLLEFHRGHGRLATMTVVRPPSRFGRVELNGDGRVTSFVEKPRSSDYVNGGFFVFEPGFRNYLDPECVLEEGPLARAAADGELMAYPHDGWWQPMDTYREFVLLNELWDSGNPPWKRW